MKPVRMTAIAATVVLVLDLLSIAFVRGVEVGEQGASSDLPTDFEALEQVYDRINDSAVEPPSDEVLLEGAIEGMLRVLEDDYAAYYDAEQYAALNEQLDGQFVGIGVVLERSETGLVVQSVLPESPAEAAGLEPRDRIVSVDGEDVRDEPTELIVERVRGEAGTSVELEVERGEEAPFEVEITRAELELPNVTSRELDENLGYVRLQSFSREAGDELRAEIERLKASDIDGLVLDLRGNPGGILGAAVDVTSLFVADGKVVTVGADPDSGRTYEVEGDPVWTGPLALLVDAGSASASEIVAGALHDTGRATLVGETTFGKGVVQTISPLEGGGGVKFTTARYYTPSGTSIDGVGIVPDRQIAAADAGEGEGAPDPQLEAAQEILTTQSASAP